MKSSDGDDMLGLDFIGDVHGHADTLESLLQMLGYRKRDGAYRQDGRHVVFVGDYIDRGPKIRETLHIVRAMVDAGSGTALMGNHEFNAVCYHLKNSEGVHLRAHTPKNFDQHKETLGQFKGWEDEYEMWIAWFRTLPLVFETKKVRAVHACWYPEGIKTLRQTKSDKMLSKDWFQEASQKGADLFLAIETVLKGREVELPAGVSFMDKDGHRRTEARVKWWMDPDEHAPGDLVFGATLDESHDQIDLAGKWKPYGLGEIPVFFGHYWLKGEPELYQGNVCCLDYSVARDGYLVGYRFDGEAELEHSKLVYVR